jgi:hypothetical protein
MNWDKIQQRFIRFLQVGSVVFTGAVINSLWISHNDYWQTAMPIVLICLSLERYLSRD